jgi:uncharacterized protein (DUF433 family)
MAWFDEQVAHYEGVQGGTAVVAGTRTPVATISAMYQMYGDVAEILRGLPHLDDLQVRAALAYALAHAQEMAAEERLQQDAADELLRSSPVPAR